MVIKEIASLESITGNDLNNKLGLRDHEGTLPRPFYQEPGGTRHEYENVVDIHIDQIIPLS